MMADQWVQVVAPKERVTTCVVQGIPLVLAQVEFEWRAYLDDCPDENRPLGPKVGRRAIVCCHHGASFSVESGCLLQVGNAHHQDRCLTGLYWVDVRRSGEGVLEVFLSGQLRTFWGEVRRQRLWNSFRRALTRPIRIARTLINRSRVRRRRHDG